MIRLQVQLAETLFANIGVDVSKFRTREQGGDCVYDPPPGSCAED